MFGNSSAFPDVRAMSADGPSLCMSAFPSVRVRFSVSQYFIFYVCGVPDSVGPLPFLLGKRHFSLVVCWSGWPDDVGPPPVPPVRGKRHLSFDVCCCF